MTNTNICPCNSDRPYAECCEPLLSGDRIACTAEALMRSRYTAYVVRDIAYLLRSWHPSTRPEKIDPAAIPEWHGLHIVRTEKGMDTDSEGVVEFQATSFSQKNGWRLHEVSHFVKEDGQWRHQGRFHPCRKKGPEGWPERSLLLWQREEIQEVLWTKRLM